tara:strand:+ start:397 stop:741 length:345 start_codon:yes stop_codon:yes gene_type:complete
MISYLFQTIFISIILIILLHNLYNFFKDKLTVPKTKDLVNNKQYQEIIDILNNDTSNNLHENIQTKENQINKDDMKDELKNFLKQINQQASQDDNSKGPFEANLYNTNAYSSYL